MNNNTSMKLHPASSRLVNSGIVTGATIAALLFTLLGMPQIVTAQDEQDNWEPWKPLADGFMARKRKPTIRTIDSSQLQSQNSSTLVQKRSKKSKKSWGGVSSQTLASSHSADISYWLRTSTDQLHGIAVSDLLALVDSETALNGSNKAKRRAIKKIRRSLRNGEGFELFHAGDNVPWHYDRSSDKLLFVGSSIRSMFTYEDAYMLDHDD